MGQCYEKRQHCHGCCRVLSDAFFFDTGERFLSRGRTGGETVGGMWCACAGISSELAIGFRHFGRKDWQEMIWRDREGLNRDVSRVLFSLLPRCLRADGPTILRLL